MTLYVIINKINKKKYYGITSNYNERVRYHKTRSFNKNSKEYEKVLYRAFRKYGIDNFEFEVLHTNLDRDEARDLEKKYIKDNNSLSHENGYNVSPGGELDGARGEDHASARITEEIATDIINRRLSGEDRQDVFNLYKDKISFHGFSNVWQGRSWSHINPEFSNRKKDGRIGVKHPKSVLSEEDVIYIRTRKRDGANRLDLFYSLDIDISESTFNRVWYGYTYKNIKV